MTRRAPSVVLATLLLVAQLLLGVTSVGAVPHDASQSCGGCPSVHSGSLSHDDGSSGDCGSHCSDDEGSTGTHRQGCGSGCAMAGSSHCGFSASPALPSSSPFHPVVPTDAFAADRRAVGLPDSPLFDFLRPPTRG
jgi:hypothetical protein